MCAVIALSVPVRGCGHLSRLLLVRRTEVSEISNVVRSDHDWIYTILTSMIILLSKLRDRSFRRVLRLDRPIPWCMQGTEHLWMSCCDCGLEHFFVIGHSGTAVRPVNYNYSMRFDAKAWTDPDPELGGVVEEAAKKEGLI